MQRITLLLILIHFFSSCNNKPENQESSLDCSLLLHNNAKHLKGEDGGEWLMIAKDENLSQSEYRICSFYEQDCQKHWDGVFILVGKDLPNLNAEYEFIPLSTYESCQIKQSDKIYKFLFSRKFE